MGLLADYLERQVLAPRLQEQGVMVWYDRRSEWLAWARWKVGHGCLEGEAQGWSVTIGGLQAWLIPFTGSYYEVIRATEQLLREGGAPVLVYVAGEEPPEQLTPLRELECLSGAEERADLRHDLHRVARDAFRAERLPDSRIDSLLASEEMAFDYLDSVQPGDDGGASPLQPIFGSGREDDVLPRFLGEPSRQQEVEDAGLLGQVAELAQRGLGLGVVSGQAQEPPAEWMAAHLAERLARDLLVADLRAALGGPPPKEISQIASPEDEAQQERIARVCDRLRRDHPEAYEAVARKVEADLGLAGADIDPLALAHIETFPFEERSLLAACAGLLQEGRAEQALEAIERCIGSFWLSAGRHPERHSAWRACRELARLALAVEQVEQDLPQAPKGAAGAWVRRYVAEAGWHRVDRLFRSARAQLASLMERDELEDAASTVFSAYGRVLEAMAEGFVDAYQACGWELADIPAQTSIYERFVRKRSAPVAYFHVDAMRYEMGAELADIVQQAGALDVQLQPAAAVAPTITDLGMVALLPGAERSFTMAERDQGGITGAIDGKPLPTADRRMELAKAEVPGLEEMPLDELVHRRSRKDLERIAGRASVVVVRSQEIDGAGESLPDSVAQTVMGNVLETVRQGIQRLAQAGVEAFVITADHGHLHGERRGEEMRIDPPQGGKEVDRHRRCWVGRGGDTPSACVRLSAGDLGYSGTDLDLVTPRGVGVLKAGGSLSFYHGGLSLQELLVPVLTFRLARQRPDQGAKGGDMVQIASVPEAITNMIFSLTLERIDLPMEPLQVRVIAVDAEESRIVGGARFAQAGWDGDAQTVTLSGSEPVDVGVQLSDDRAKSVRVRVVQADTDRVLQESGPIPVRITR